MQFVGLFFRLLYNYIVESQDKALFVLNVRALIALSNAFPFVKLTITQKSVL